MTSNPTLMMVCNTCGRTIQSASFITGHTPCICGDKMVCRTSAVNTSPPPKIGRTQPGYDSICWEAIENQFNIGNLRRSYHSFGRASDMKWIHMKILAYAVKNKISKFPITTAIKIALCLDISDKMAFDYIRQMGESEILLTQGSNFIINLQNAEKSLEVYDAQSIL